jgi:SAM-dependent methyltransferase
VEEVKCLFCYSGTEKVFWEENGYQGRKCDKCGLIYMSPRPTEEEMKALYEQGIAGGATAEEQIENRYLKDLNALYTLKLIQKYKPTGSLLEIGPGGGQFLQAAKSARFAPYAVEINEKQAQYLEDTLKIPTENCSASWPYFFKELQFDVIYHKDLLSHLHNPLEVFKTIHKRLKDDGILVFETGNFGDLSKRWITFLGRLSYPEHIYLFSRQNILDLLSLSGFACLETHHHTIVVSALFWRVFFSLKGFLAQHVKTARKGADKMPKLLAGQKEEAVDIMNKPFQPISYTFTDKLKDLLPHLLAYRLSKLFPHSWPSTIICIAQKVR